MNYIHMKRTFKGVIFIETIFNPRDASVLSQFLDKCRHFHKHISVLFVPHASFLYNFEGLQSKYYN